MRPQPRYRTILLTSWLRHIGVLFCSALLLRCNPAFATQGSSTESPEEAAVTRKVRLRLTASTESKTLLILRAGEILELLDPNPSDGFYHVQSQGGDEGWVSERYVKVRQSPAKTLTAIRAGLNFAAGISETWEKPVPNKTTFTGPEGNCPWNGNNSDPDTYVRKNRSDVPDNSQVHDVMWKAIHDMPFPVDKPLRADWTPEHLQEIAKFEGVALRTTGYIVAIKPQNGHGEGTNCGFTLASETDTHIALVGEQGDAEKDSVVIEFTPRFLKRHPRWSKTVLSKYIDNDTPVRITGWLMLDPDHRAHLNRYRFTLWEIHPITKIEVLTDGQWRDVDGP